MRERFIAAANGEETDRPPVWMMRQAGRYLPEYRALREDYSFLEAISTPDVATEISLQPWHRFHPDGVVMYSDILTILEPLGFEYHLESGVGPVIENPINRPEQTDRSISDVQATLPYVGTILRRLSDRLGEQAAVIGFAGGPFTLAAYATEGTPSKSYMALRRLRMAHPDAFDRLLERLTTALAEYLTYQVAAGADVIQLFDTYAGLLSPAGYREDLLPYHKRLCAAVDVPTILFARNMGGRLELLAESGADVIGLDWTVGLSTATPQLSDQAVQGNLDPAALYGSPTQVRKRTKAMLERAPEQGYIANLGHGIDRETPIENVKAFFETIRGDYSE